MGALLLMMDVMGLLLVDRLMFLLLLIMAIFFSLDDTCLREDGVQTMDVPPSTGGLDFGFYVILGIL